LPGSTRRKSGSSDNAAQDRRIKPGDDEGIGGRVRFPCGPSRKIRQVSGGPNAYNQRPGCHVQPAPVRAQ
jgi:hypothetical protein